jgi:probable phosphoglycerate mutase
MGLRLYLLRHGNTFEAGETPVQVGAGTDIELTARGREQASNFAALLKQEQITPTHIYSGHLKRQKQTAEIIAQELKCEDRCSIGLAALNEIDYGSWEGLSVESIQDIAPQQYRDWSEAAVWPGDVFEGTLSRHLAEMKSFLNQLLESYSPNDTVVVVSSNGILRFFRSFDSEDWKGIIARREVEQSKVKTGSYCKVFLSPGPKIRIESWDINPSQLLSV